MLLRVLFFLLFFAPASVALTQNLSIETILKRYYEAPNDSLRLILLGKVSNYYIHNNVDSGIKYVNMYFELAEKSNSKLFLSRAYALKSDIHEKKEDYKSQLKFEILALKLREELKDSMRIGQSYARLGNLYTKMQDYRNGFRYYKKAEWMLKSSKDPKVPERSQILNYALGQFYLNQNKFDSALVYLKLAEAYKPPNPDNSDEARWAQTKLKIALVYVGLHKQSYALLYYKEALRLFAKLNRRKEIAECEQGVAQILLQKKSFSTAAVSLEKAKRAAIKSGDKKNLLNVYATYATLYDSLKDYEQKSNYLMKMMELKDTLSTNSFNEAVAREKSRFETQEREKENVILAQKNSLQSVEIKTARLKLSLFVLLATFLALATYLVVYKRRLATLQKLKILEQSNLGLQMNPHFTFNAINSAQNFILSNRNEEAHQFLSDMSKLIRLTLNYSRDKTITLKQELDFLSLYISLEEQRIKDKINLIIKNVEELDLDSVIVPSLLLQPLIENSIWHGLTQQEEKRIELDFETKDDLLKIVIRDNGSGLKK